MNMAYLVHNNILWDLSEYDNLDNGNGKLTNQFQSEEEEIYCSQKNTHSIELETIRFSSRFLSFHFLHLKFMGFIFL